MPAPDPLGGVLAPIGAFLRQFGLATFIALVFVWWAYEDRREGFAATAMQIKDLNGQLLHVSGLLSEHHEADKRQSAEVSRLLSAQCLNMAEQISNTDRREAARDRCLGLSR